MMSSSLVNSHMLFACATMREFRAPWQGGLALNLVDLD